MTFLGQSHFGLFFPSTAVTTGLQQQQQQPQQPQQQQLTYYYYYGIHTFGFLNTSKKRPISWLLGHRAYLQ